MKHSHKKSFDWYSMQQRYSIRKYYFGAVSVLLGTALVLGAAASVQTVQAEENKQETTNSISVGRGEAATKPAEVSASNKEKTYAAPTVANPVETTPVKTGEVTKPAEKVEEAKDKKEEVTHQDAIDKSKLLTALSRAKKLESKLYTEASAANLQTSIQAGQSLLGKADASEAELSAAESSIQSSIIGLELRSNSNKGTVSETPVAKKANIVEAKEETNPAATTDRSAVDSAVLPTSTAAKVETTSAPASINEILKPGLSLSDARQNPAIRKEDVDRGYSGFRAAPAPTNQPVTNLGNNTVFTDISRGSHTFRGNGNSRRGNPIHFDVTTTRVRNRVDFSIRYSGPGEFVNNNFILDKGNGFGEPSRATVSTPKLRDQVKNISKGGNFVSHSGYSLEAAVETSTNQTIKFSLPIANPNGDLSVRLRPVTFNVGQGESGSATSNDPYSNSNYYFREKPLLLDANPNGGTNNKTVSEDIDFQTVYLPTSKLPEGQTRLVREGEKGQRQIIYKVHQLGNETILGLPISNSVIKEVKPRIMQIGVAKDLIDTVKPRVDQNKVGDTNNLTFYLDNDGNGVYTEGVDELVQKIAIKDGAKGEKGDRGERGLTGAQGAKGEKGDRGERGLTGAQGAKGEKGDRGERGLTGAKGEKGDQGERGLTGAQGEKGDRGERGLTGAKGEKGAQGQAGRDGVTPTVTVKDNKNDGTHTITINDGRGNVTSTVVRDGFDGASPLVATQRNDADKTTTVIFYYDKNGNNELDASDKKLKEVVIADGAKGEKGERGDRGETGAAGRDGKTPKITTARGADGRSTDITFTIPGEEPVTVNVKDGKDGRTPNIDLNALAEAAVRLNNQRSGRVRRALSDTPAPTEKPKVIGTRITAYLDNNGNGKYDPGVDEPISSADILNGTDGANGAAGAAGADGRNGAELLSGPKAPTADDGKDGDTYIDATTGDVYKKENGTWDKIGNIRGPQGLKGADGVAGPQGPQGLQGRDGAQGPAGRDGREGVPGPAGRDGRDGAAGRDGRDGRDGKDVLNGKVDPTTEGKDGDKYVNTETGDVFVKNNGTWEKEGNIKGPKGDKGAEGAQGPKGADGAQGLPGRDGRDGRDGKDVLNGKVDPTTEGKDGDKYVNTETGDVFVKNNGTWEKEGNIKGPKGDKGERGEDGKTPEVTVTPGKDGHSTDITFTVPGKDPVTVNVKDGENGLNGKTPKVDLLRVEGQNGNPSHTIVTFYTDENNDGKYTPGTDELLGSEMIKDGAKGADGRDGKSLLTVKDGKETKVYQEDPAHPGQPLNPEKPLAVIKDGVDGVSPTVTAVRKDEEGHKGVEITVDNHDGSQPTTVFVHDGEKGETGATGQDGQTPTITTQRGQDGQSTVVTITTPGKDPVTFTVKDGKNGRDGRTPYIDLNALVDAVRRGARRARSVEANPDEVTASTQPSTTGSTASQPVDGTRITAYFDNNGNGKYDPDVDEVISTADILNGNNGANGAAGHDGRDGRNGAELLSGVTAPTSKDGKDGDTYIDANTGDVYKKENGSWNKIGNIRGPQGTAGEKGATGEKGEKGDNGKDGRAPKIKVEDIALPSRNRRATDAATTPTRNGIRITVYDDVNDNGVYDEDVDKVLNSKDIYNGIDGRDGSAPTITTKDNGDGTHTITVQNPDGSESTTVVKDGKDGKTANITTTENPDGSHTITVTNPDGTTKETVVKNGKDGKTPKVEVTDNNDGTHTVKVTDGDGNVTNAVIKDGKDGKAATATTTENPDGSHRVTITNPDGTKNEFVVKNGRDGVDGRTPTASVRDNGDGSHTIVITNPEGVTTETTVRDGKSPKVTITDEQNGTHKISVLNGDGTTTETIIKDGKSPVATVKDNQDGTYTIRVENGNGTVSETTVRDGKSPTAKVVDNGDGTHTITVVNSDGTTTTTTVRDGKEPKLEVIDNNNGSHTIKVTGADGKETTTTIFDGKSPKANIVDNGDGTHTLTIVDSDGREYKSIIKDGKDGKDGVSPTVTVKNNNDGTHVVTIINPDGSKTEMVIKDGKDGKSPKVSVEDNGNGSHTITIINSDGTVTKTVVKDGKDGRDGKDGKCGCQDKPVTPSNDKPVPPTRNVPQGPTFAMPEPPVHELPEFNGGVPGMPEVNDKPILNIPEVPTQPNPNVPVQPVTPLTSNSVVPTTVKENHGDKLPETGSQSDYISVLLGSGILLSLYVGRRKED
ncbi:TPA: YSIRK signal domain/LPXTG anchor domain surface protein [Streptococcus pneumoniae]|nr:LPXTG-motif cell wall anchor domain protein [Streptococcus pneumoniae SPAR95]HEW3471314.1 YSIRK signal domain/LPXTG anchor domain surface protein [Streptococcus pneumoniae]HEW7302314.1 YSIRK signal domain/LPXTG anchor domain surface protein [Streptococcus pneumoniae]HEW8045443.1 YSIRK signal domain/LPXTG anchor domain surface protein [Streptococcus pneumoniae]HEW8066760.1 YSIRK signal domain/LPXTG anchor domain surface protein [Streptococcus pneumoniae]